MRITSVFLNNNESNVIVAILRHPLFTALLDDESKTPHHLLNKLKKIKNCVSINAQYTNVMV